MLTVRVSSHAEFPQLPPADGKFVVSTLRAGESRIMSAVPSIKMVVEGEEIHEVDGRPWRVKPGQMLLVDRGAEYRAVLRGSSPTLGLCIYLPGDPMPPSEDGPILGRALVQSTEVGPLGALMRQHLKALRNDPSAQAADIDMAAISGALVETIQTASSEVMRLDIRKLSTRSEVMNRLEMARAYLHDHPDRAVTLGELARAVGLSTFHLARYFSLAFGQPPARYHRRIRLERAAASIARGEQSVSTIAEAAGYADLSSFSHAFRRAFGIAPSLHRA